LKTQPQIFLKRTSRMGVRPQTIYSHQFKQGCLKYNKIYYHTFHPHKKACYNFILI